jgi:hypothetical protein
LNDKYCVNGPASFFLLLLVKRFDIAVDVRLVNLGEAVNQGLEIRIQVLLPISSASLLFTRCIFNAHVR